MNSSSLFLRQNDYWTIRYHGHAALLRRRVLCNSPTGWEIGAGISVEPRCSGARRGEAYSTPPKRFLKILALF